MDIGDIVSQTKSSGEFCKAMQTLTAAQKYNLLKNHKEPHTDRVFPTQYVSGCNGSNYILRTYIHTINLLSRDIAMTPQRSAFSNFEPSCWQGSLRAWVTELIGWW